MPIPFACPHCGHQTLVEDKYAGQTGECVECGEAITVPLAASQGSLVPDGKVGSTAASAAGLALGCGLLILLFGLLLLTMTFGWMF